MHASIWRFRGDPDELLRAYEAMVADIPASNFALHLCLRDADGVVVVDTCPSREAFQGFAAGAMRELLRRHDLPEPERVDDYPVHAAFSNGARVV